MNAKLYKLMNWPEIEEIIYSDGSDPHRILGPHKVGTSLLVQAFLPGAEKVDVVLTEGAKTKKIAMEMADEAGFFAALIPRGRDIRAYRYEVTDAEGKTSLIDDPYRFTVGPDREDSIKFDSGIHYHVYETFGAHPMQVDGVDGTLFSVWAPGAARVSVVGPFNAYDGRVHQMRLNDPSGVFSIFLPGVGEGDTYSYEVKTREGFLFLRPDPYAVRYDEQAEHGTVIRALRSFAWTDEAWMSARRSYDKHNVPLSICEISLDRFAADRGGDFTYRTLAPELVKYLKTNGFNAVELMPLMEHLADDPFAVTGFYAPSARLGEPEELMEMINELHRAEIRVIMDFPATFFPEENRALRQFPGGPLYEYGDVRGMRPGSPYVVFDYGRNQVQNYLTACALYWLTLFHIDGLRLPDISKILYLDYDRAPGEWMPNIYGSNENLEAEAFIRHLNDVIEKKDPGILRITKETACYPQVTGPTADGGLGFDFKWNNGWSRDFLSYLRFDPIYRAAHHNELTFSMIYHYSERFVLAFSHEDIGGHTPMLEMMPGDEAAKDANVRFALAYLYLHPGRKMVYRGISDLTKKQDDRLSRFTRDLNALYLSHTALYEQDDVTDGFRWINSMAAELCYMSFLRIPKRKRDRLLVVANMAGVERTIDVGVPEDGKYTEVFHTDRKEYGGSGLIHEEPLEAIAKNCDDLPYSVQVTLAPLSIAVFDYKAYSAEEKKIRVIRHDTQRKMEADKERMHEELVELQKAEEERLLNELRARYAREIVAQDKAIEDKYHKLQEDQIKGLKGGKK